MAINRPYSNRQQYHYQWLCNTSCCTEMYWLSEPVSITGILSALLNLLKVTFCGLTQSFPVSVLHTGYTYSEILTSVLKAAGSGVASLGTNTCSLLHSLVVSFRVPFSAAIPDLSPSAHTFRPPLQDGLHADFPEIKPTLKDCPQILIKIMTGYK